MLRFFRQIRKDLLKEKRISKYLVYAVGEIILIVIGILIAFSINNWNTNKEERIKETAILKQLQTEFNSNLKQLDNKIAIRKDIIYASNKLLGCIDNPDKQIGDSVNKYIVTTQSGPTFDPIINDLASSGNLRLISNDSLKQMLSYWTYQVIQVKEEEDHWDSYNNEIFGPFLTEHHVWRTIINERLKSDSHDKRLIDGSIDSIPRGINDIGNSIYETDLNTLFNQPDFEDHLAISIALNVQINKQSYILRKRIVDILDILNREIDK